MQTYIYACTAVRGRRAFVRGLQGGGERERKASIYDIRSAVGGKKDTREVAQD